MKRLVLLILLACVGAVPAAETRNALLMGVWKYTDPSLPALPGIEADVNLMAAKLKSLGFNVTVVTNPTLGQAKQAVDDFGARLKVARGTGLFYFSGHGCENDGKNYLIPGGTSIVNPHDLDDEALSAQRVLTRMETSSTSVNLVFLDCCRNAFTKGGGELAPMRASGTFIGFATASAEAANASGRGSLYSIALVELLGTQGVGVTGMHTRVTRRVKELTRGKQVPFQYSGLDVDYELVPATSAPIVLSPSDEEIQRRIEEEVRRRMAAAAAANPAPTIGPVPTPAPAPAAPEPAPAPKVIVATAASNWAELASIPNGKQVFVLLKDGTRFPYVWNDQRKDKLVRDIKLSSGATAQASIPFSAVAEIRYEQKL